MRQFYRLIMLAAIAMLASSCHHVDEPTSDPPIEDPPEASRQLIPLAVGNSWHYTANPSFGPSCDSIARKKVLAWRDIADRHLFDAVTYLAPAFSAAPGSCTNGILAQYLCARGDSLYFGTRHPDSSDNAAVYLDYAICSTCSDTISAQQNLAWINRGMETITVPAGTFTCKKIVSVERYIPHDSTTYWFASHIGIVQKVVASYIQANRASYSLTNYSIRQ